MTALRFVKKVIGMKLEKAERLAQKHGIIVRVMKKDDKFFVGTCEYLPTRVNLHIAKDVVEEAYQG